MKTIRWVVFSLAALLLPATAHAGTTPRGRVMSPGATAKLLRQRYQKGTIVARISVDAYMKKDSTSSYHGTIFGPGPHKVRIVDGRVNRITGKQSFRTSHWAGT